MNEINCNIRNNHPRHRLEKDTLENLIFFVRKNDMIIMGDWKSHHQACEKDYNNTNGKIITELIEEENLIILND